MGWDKDISTGCVAEVCVTDLAFADVLRLAKQNRRWLGFLPDAGFKDRADRGTLLAVQRGDETLGYALFDLPGDRIKLVHLCIEKSHRGEGLGELLIKHISNRYASRTGIELACRRDFPADKFWPRVGFVAVNERAGRGRARAPLTIWALRHGHTDLFDVSAEDKDDAVLDNNVLEDLATTRPQGEESRFLDEDWITDLVDLCVTDEAFHEIHKCSDPALRRKVRGLASGLRYLQSAGDDWEELALEVERLAPKVDPGDQRHLARAAASGARFFVSRDDAVLEAASRLREGLRIEVLRPSKLILQLDRERAIGGYEPEALQGTAIEGLRPELIDEATFVKAFLNHGIGERRFELAEILRTALASPADEVRVFADEAGMAGVVIFRTDAERITVRLLRVSDSDRLAKALARQLAFIPRRWAADNRRSEVAFEDIRAPRHIRRAIEAEDFEQIGDGLRCAVLTGVEELQVELSGGLRGESQTAVAAWERRRWPRKVVGSSLETYMISIKPHWAEQLFDTNLAAATLFGRDIDLGLSREHVYYRRPGAGGHVCAPARILWYVSGGTSSHGTGHLRAVSQLVEVVRGRPEPLYERFARLGVWSRSMVLSAAADGQVMALRFTSTELLDQPLGLEGLRQLYVDHGERFDAPQSPRRVSERMFRLLYEAGSRYA